MVDLQKQRRRAFNDTLYQVELSHIPFPDEPPLIYPDAEVWERLSNRRLKKYGKFELCSNRAVPDKESPKRSTARSSISVF